MAEKKALGVLILHGFTGSLDTVRGLVPTVEKLGLPWRMPVLRGHGTRPEDLKGVQPREWVEDAESALKDLLGECDRAVVVGLSMGGLVALNVAVAHPQEVAGLVLVGTFMRCADPLAHLTPLLKLLFPYWDSPPSFADQSRAQACTNYKRFPTDTFSRLLNFASETERRLGEVQMPVLILHARKDTVAHPIVPKVLEDKLGSTDKRTVWFERSGHEMMQDLEAEEVFRVSGEDLADFEQALAS
ncbi:MAG TPA: alpha/beta fold hydrolase [Oscillatoriaceae cyanobacterium]